MGGVIRAGGFRVYYSERGRGKAVILLHGGFQDDKMWGPQVVALSRFFRVIRPDLPAHGRTMGADTTLTAAEVVRIFMDSLHLRTASFIGLSVGSVSLSLALFNRMDSVAGTGDQALFARAFTQTWCVGPLRDSGEVDPKVRDYVYTTTLWNRLHHRPGDWLPFGRHPGALDFTKWSRPLLLVAGDKDVPYIPAIARYIHGAVRGSRLRIVNGVAHMLNMEQPVAFNREVLEFLNG